MKTQRVIAIGVGCFLLGAGVQAGMEQARRPAFSPEIYAGKEPRAAAEVLLEGALQLAEQGSWERIAVGRAWYLGGDRARGQQILDAVTGSKDVEASDWARVARIYEEAGEWDKAQQAFEKVLALDPDDDSGILEYGSFANLHKDREKAEALFTKALTKKPRHFWHWVGAGGSYLGVRPQ